MCVHFSFFFLLWAVAAETGNEEEEKSEKNACVAAAKESSVKVMEVSGCSLRPAGGKKEASHSLSPPAAVREYMAQRRVVVVCTVRWRSRLIRNTSCVSRTRRRYFALTAVM